MCKQLRLQAVQFNDHLPRAVKAFRRCGERQGEIYAEAPPGTIRDAEAVEWQLADEIRVNETGFRGTDGETLDTFEIAAMWQGYAFTR